MKVNLSYLVLVIFLVSCGNATENVSKPSEIPELLLKVSPANDQENIANDIVIQAIFSIAMDPQTISTQTFLIENIAADISYDEASKTARLKPNSDLEYATKYIITLKSSITAINGKQLGVDYSWNFTTNSQPSIVATNLNTTSGLGLDFQPEIQFSEAVDLNGLENHIKLLDENGVEIATNLIPSNDNTTITITPINRLIPDSQYKLIILGSVKDTQNTNLKNPTSISFTTVLPPTLNLTSTDSSAEYFNPSFRFNQNGNGLGVWYINDGNNIRIAASFFNVSTNNWTNFEFFDLIPSSSNLGRTYSNNAVQIASNGPDYTLVWQVNNKFRSVVYKNGTWSKVSEIVSSSNVKNGVRLSAGDQQFLLTWTESITISKSEMQAAVFSNTWSNAQPLTETVNGYVALDYKISVSGNSFMLVWVESTNTPKTVYIKTARFNGTWQKTSFSQINPIEGSIVLFDLLAGNTNGEFHLFYSNATATATTSYHHVFVLDSLIGDHWITKISANLPNVYRAKILKIGSEYGLTWRDVDNNIYFTSGIENGNRDITWKTKVKIGDGLYNILPQMIEQNGIFTVIWHDFSNLFVNSIDIVNPNVTNVKSLALNTSYSTLDLDLVNDNNNIGLHLQGNDSADKKLGQLVLFDGTNWGTVQNLTANIKDVSGFYGANGASYVIQHRNKNFGLATFQKITLTKSDTLGEAITLEPLSSGVLDILYHEKNSVGNLLVWSQLHGSKKRAFANVYTDKQWTGNQLLGTYNYLLSVAKNDNEFIVALATEDVDKIQILAKRYTNTWQDTEKISVLVRGGYVNFDYLELEVVSSANGHMLTWGISQTDPQFFTNYIIDASIYVNGSWKTQNIAGPIESDMYFNIATNQDGYAVTYHDFVSETTNAIIYTIDSTGIINNNRQTSLQSVNHQNMLLFSHDKNYLVVDKGFNIDYAVYTGQWSVPGSFPGINSNSIRSFNIIANNVGYMAYWTNTLNSNIDYNYFNTTWNNDYSNPGYTPIANNQKVSLAVNANNKFETFLSNKISDTDATISYKIFSNPSWSNETFLHTYTGLGINEDLAIHHIKNGSNRILFWGSDVSKDYFMSRQSVASDEWSIPTNVDSNGPIEYDPANILVSDNRVHATWIVLDTDKNTNRIVSKNGFRLQN